VQQEQQEGLETRVFRDLQDPRAKRDNQVQLERLVHWVLLVLQVQQEAQVKLVVKDQMVNQVCKVQLDR